jgi:hypothetical protein
VNLAHYVHKKAGRDAIGVMSKEVRGAFWDDLCEHAEALEAQRLALGVVLVGLLIALSVVLLCPVRAKCEEPREPILRIALDDSPQSQMLKAELTRDWHRPNPRVALSRRQNTDLAVIGHTMAGIQWDINRTFAVTYVGRDAVPFPTRLHLPAIKMPSAQWESIDRRAFAFKTRPLLTLDWYRTRYAALYDREASLDTLATDACRDEGYSGPDQVETPPPWETVP